MYIGYAGYIRIHTYLISPEGRGERGLVRSNGPLLSIAKKLPPRHGWTYCFLKPGIHDHDRRNDINTSEVTSAFMQILWIQNTLCIAGHC